MISGILNGLLALTFVGNMSAPFCAKEETKSSPVHETETAGNLTPIDGGGGITFHDNEPADNSISGATEINADCAVIGTLYDKKMESGGDYEADHDFYRFSLQDSQNMTFSFKGSSSYRMRLLRYDGKSGTFLTEYAFSSAAHFYELTPATYYLDVYPQSKEDMSRRKYEITIGSAHDVNNADIDIGPLKKQGYRIFLWESERRPYNFDAWGEDKQTLYQKTQIYNGKEYISGGVDPIYKVNHRYLDSRLFFTNPEDVKNLQELFFKFHNDAKQKIADDKIKDARLKVIQSAAECAVALIPFDQINTINTIADISDDILSFSSSTSTFVSALRFLAKPEFPEFKVIDDVFYSGRLCQACEDFPKMNYDDKMFKLDRYFYLTEFEDDSSRYAKKTGVQSNVTCYHDQDNLDQDNPLVFGKITACQKMLETSDEYAYGMVHCFKSLEDFRQYIKR